jgi:hypothetical protein
MVEIALLGLTAVLLREDDTTLQRRVCENDKTVKTYATAADWLARESAYLRTVVGCPGPVSVRPSRR